MLLGSEVLSGTATGPMEAEGPDSWAASRSGPRCYAGDFAWSGCTASSAAIRSPGAAWGAPRSVRSNGETVLRLTGDWCFPRRSSASGAHRPATITGGRRSPRRHRIPGADRREEEGPMTAPAAAELSDRLGLVFPGVRPGRPLSENTHAKLLRELGFGAVSHGFRPAELAPRSSPPRSAPRSRAKRRRRGGSRSRPPSASVATGPSPKTADPNSETSPGRWHSRGPPWSWGLGFVVGDQSRYGRHSGSQSLTCCGVCLPSLGSQTLTHFVMQT